MDCIISNNLIEKCKTGDRKSLKELYMLTIDRFKVIAWRYCPDNEDAMDIVHNAYLMIFKSMNQFDCNKGNFESWSTRIIINEALQLLRKKNKIIPTDFKSNLYFDNTEMNLEVFTLQDVKRVILQLEQPQRVIFNMYFIDELTYREIGHLLNIKESSARATVSRAKKAFLEIWGKFDNCIAL